MNKKKKTKHFNFLGRSQADSCVRKKKKIGYKTVIKYQTGGKEEKEENHIFQFSRPQSN